MANEDYSFNSSNLDTGSYDPDTKELVLTFLRGGEYTYSNVPPEVWESLKFAPSAGRFFREQIKDKY